MKSTEIGNTAILLTGGIGSGKSLAASFLTELDVPVYDFDSRTKGLYDFDTDLCRKVAEVMSPYSDEPVLTSEGHINRQILARTVFGNPTALKALEDVVHPAVLADFRVWRAACPQPVVAAESAIALSKPLFAGEFDKVILITASGTIRKSRVIARDSLSEDEVTARMLAQPPASPSPKVDFIIDNSGDINEFRIKLYEVMSKLTQRRMSVF